MCALSNAEHIQLRPIHLSDTLRRSPSEQEAVLDPASVDDLSTLAVLWQRALPQHALSRSRLQEWLEHPACNPELLRIACYDGRCVGFIAGSSPAQGRWHHLSCIVVDPAWQGRGVGTALWNWLETSLQQQSARPWRLGGDIAHLFAGLPLEANAVTWEFFQRRGFQAQRVVFDMLLDCRLLAVAAPLAPELQQSTDTSRALHFLQKHFPGRWYDEAHYAANNGATLLGLQHKDTPHTIVGFAVLYPPACSLQGPSRIWDATLPPQSAGLGPIGVAAEYRGRGYGLMLLLEAVRYCMQAGAAHIIINWTDLTDFYGRIGARVWRGYQVLERPLAASLEKDGS